MKILKIITMISILFLLICAVSADVTVDDFKAPYPLSPVGNHGFADGKGHNINFYEYDDDSHKLWFENDTDYVVQKYETNDSFYIYADDENDCGILEVVEVNGEKLIVNSWTPNGPNEAKEILDNLLFFNERNNLKPIIIEE